MDSKDATTILTNTETLQTYTSEALAFEENFEKTFSDHNLVYTALNKADRHLEKIQIDLLEESASKISEVSGLLGIFRDSFMTMEGNVTDLLSKKGNYSPGRSAINSRTHIPVHDVEIFQQNA
ncbi:MAG: hypothetical protein QGF00_28210 [Planctomycetota bacterium]|nr:hypothetical protein [Planctomycetota bacterium]